MHVFDTDGTEADFYNTFLVPLYKLERCLCFESV